MSFLFQFSQKMIFIWSTLLSLTTICLSLPLTLLSTINHWLFLCRLSLMIFDFPYSILWNSWFLFYYSDIPPHFITKSISGLPFVAFIISFEFFFLTRRFDFTSHSGVQHSPIYESQPLYQELKILFSASSTHLIHVQAIVVFFRRCSSSLHL